MGKMIYAGTKSRAPAKKKPGWAEEKAAEQAWLNKINQMTLFAQPGRKYKDATVVRGKKVEVVKDGTLALPEREHAKIGKSVMTPGGSTGRKVINPLVQYKEDQEMALRELAARARKFNAAPAYNKGGDQFVTEEELVKQLSSNKRR